MLPARLVLLVITCYISKPKHSWHYPDLYTYKDELIYPQFQGRLEAKLQINKLAISHKEEKVQYIIDCLKGDITKRIYLQVEFIKVIDQIIVYKLFRQIDLVFVDLQKESKAITKINKIKQKGYPFYDFLQEFNQILLEVRGQAQVSIVKKGLLKAALSRELTKQLISREEPIDYTDYYTGIQKVIDDL